MNRLVAAFIILGTTLVFTVIGVAVGYLASSSVLTAAKHSPDDAQGIVIMSYSFSALGGVAAGFVLSCFVVWLVGLKKDA